MDPLMEMEKEIKTYVELLDILYNLNSFKEGLYNSKKLSEAFENPCDKYKTVHVSGTNGKGSLCYKIYTLLKLKKYKVGLFSSPHIFSLRERIIINDELINEEDLIFLANIVLKKAKEIGIRPNFFEIMVNIAFLYFLNKKVDYAIIETGIGGRLDATNIMKKPELIVITSIGYDHLNILGTDLKDISNEKIGIFKKNAKIVIGPSVSIYKNVFEKAKELNCNIKAVEPEPRGETYNEENSRIALEGLKFLNINIDNVFKPMINIKPPLRFQYLAQEQIYHIKKKYVSNYLYKSCYENPHAVILDVGHNETAMDRLCRDINYFHKDKLIRICISLSKPRSLNIFQPFIAHFPYVLKDVFYLQSSHTRTYEFEDIIDIIKNDDKINDKLKQIILDSSKKINQWVISNNKENKEEIGKTDKLYKKGNIPLIIKNAFLECCKDNSILLITGTFYIFDEVLETFDINTNIHDHISIKVSSNI